MSMTTNRQRVLSAPIPYSAQWKGRLILHVLAWIGATEQCFRYDVVCHAACNCILRALVDPGLHRAKFCWHRYNAAEKQQLSPINESYCYCPSRCRKQILGSVEPTFSILYDDACTFRCIKIVTFSTKTVPPVLANTKST